MEYLKIIIAIFFVVTQLYIAYKKYKQEKLSTFFQLANQAYQFIRKENLMGKIINDDRLVKALEMLDQLLQSKGLRLTPDLKDEAEKAFKAWHAEDKANILMNTPAVESGKKSEG